VLLPGDALRGDALRFANGESVVTTWRMVDTILGRRVLVYILKRAAECGCEAVSGAALRDYRRQLRILAVVKKTWKDCLATIFLSPDTTRRPPKSRRTYRSADITIERIGDLADADLATLFGNGTAADA
jgi:hypothetical protein